MSPAMKPRPPTSPSFPRVSGDEPINANDYVSGKMVFPA